MPQPPPGQPPAAPGWAGYPQGYPPGYPQGYAQGYPQGYPPGYPQGYRKPGSPLAALLIIGGIGAIIAIIALLGVALLVGSSSSSGASLVMAPSTVHCGQGDSVMTIRLPASMTSADRITLEIDGMPVTSMTVGESFTKQSDGTWLYKSTSSSGWSCTSTGANAVGKHVMTVRDSNGKVLAEASYTLTP